MQSLSAITVEPPEAPADATLELPPGSAAVLRCGIRLSAADDTFPLLLPADRPAELLRGIATFAVPNVAGWFSGLANLRGDLVPVFDLLACHGLAAPAERRKPDLLVIGSGAAAFAIPVQREPEVLRLAASPAAAPRLLGGFIHNVWQGEDSLWYDFDFDRWLAGLASGDHRDES